MAGGAAPGASLVARTLDVLGAFDDGHRRLTLSAIAERAGLSPATALRIVRELVAGGALVRTTDRTYVIGRRLWALGLLSPTQTGLRDVASPYLQDIHAATRATVHLAVRDDDEVLYLDRISGQTSVPVVSRVGGRLPLYCTGVGKALLAHAPEEVVGRVMHHLVPHTPYTLTSPGMLARQLARIRTEGWATTSEEMTLGACSVAVPVWSGEEVVASIGVVVPDFRREKARLVAALTVAARAIGRAVSVPPVRHDADR
ncbi:IclR family transcriptional regulator [Nocardioides sp. BP30]|uniref:IclR family transcriptional regulator n=1 Tax=Nocardioides sp. BP30 TaxID=3036374 RepID=UPI002468BB67|nr:IclR family transcriptional regulator [Nocardioides sp. BP30]WGL52415.1 IclR family transcriptional regulator [Nocardioides sp. BP30]